MPEINSLEDYCRETAVRAKVASRRLVGIESARKNEWLHRSAAALRDNVARIVSANNQDLQLAPSFGLSDSALDRLRLDAAGIDKIAAGLLQVAALPDPVGELIEGSVRPNGLKLQKVRVPMGVVFFIYESRPNVTADAAAICVKSGNAVILRGGKEAAHSSRAIVELLNEQAIETGIPENSVQLVATSDRDAVGHFLRLNNSIDVAIPRGGAGLIRRVVDEATMPVIKHFDGNCHVYVDSTADLEMAARVVMNSKTQRMGVCNACESLLVHAAVADDFLPTIGSRLASAGVEIRGDAATCQRVGHAMAASEADWSTEYLGPTISVRVVESLEDAIDHINHYGSHHTDAIITNDLSACERFTTSVDSAAVIVNASTRFNDGGEFGLGAEIGISTDKFHARGPCGLRELTSYKYVVYGNGQIRE